MQGSKCLPGRQRMGVGPCGHDERDRRFQRVQIQWLAGGAGAVWPEPLGSLGNEMGNKLVVALAPNRIGHFAAFPSHPGLVSRCPDGGAHGTVTDSVPRLASNLDAPPTSSSRGIQEGSLLAAIVCAEGPLGSRQRVGHRPSWPSNKVKIPALDLRAAHMRSGREDGPGWCASQARWQTNPASGMTLAPVIGSEGPPLRPLLHAPMRCITV